MSELDLASFWREPNLAKLATINADGTPHLAPIWYLYDGRHLLMATRPDSRKVRNIRRDPRVTVCIDRPTPPYAGVLVQGTAALEQVAYQDLAVPLAVRYLGQDAGELIGARYAREDLMTIRVTIDRLQSWDYGAAAEWRPPHHA
ncbi:MAG TPA: PPOX class F420-dependent oxidoreductase [Chloroflexota bacterium]|nr:PPOX class F420-dependent oxidoreductase [Chloroflexota bacterium]